MKITHETLVEAANEINKVIDPDPSVRTDVEDNLIKQDMNEALQLYDSTQDAFSAPVARTIRRIFGLKVEICAEPEPEPASESEPPKSDEPVVIQPKVEPEVDESKLHEYNRLGDTTEPEPDMKGEDLVAFVEVTKKLADLKDTVQYRDEFKALRDKLDTYTGLQGPRHLKADMLEILSADKGPEPEPEVDEKSKKLDIADNSPEKGAEQSKPKRQTKAKGKPRKAARRGHSAENERYTRSHALVEAIKYGGTREDLVRLSNEFYVKHGGNDNENTARFTMRMALPTLLILGSVIDQDGFISFVIA